MIPHFTKFVFVGLTILLQNLVSAQVNNSPYRLEFQKKEVQTNASLRGLCVVSEKTVWASGSGATVIRTTDAGKTWTVTQIKEAGEIEFRDVEAANGNSSILFGAGSPALFYKTTDGGKSWSNVYRNDHSKIFFDAAGFWDAENGIAFSDPVSDALFILSTSNSGKSWSTQNPFPKTLLNEAGFAASGTCLTTFGKNHVWIGLGGKPDQGQSNLARVLYSSNRGKTWSGSATTIPRSESAGIFSLTFISTKIGFPIGGDYKNPGVAKNNLSLTTDGGKTWRAPKHSTPTGFRSCICAAKTKSNQWVLLAPGTNGTDISTDLGESWSRASDAGYHAIDFAPDKTKGWASGGSGRVASFELKAKK